MRPDHEKQLKTLQTQDTKIIAAPGFPYDENTIIVEKDTTAEDGGFKQVEEFVKNDPYVKNKLVTDYTIREFAMKGSLTEFDRLAQKFVIRS
jgi:uncharacterized protein YciI